MTKERLNSNALLLEQTSMWIVVQAVGERDLAHLHSLLVFFARFDEPSGVAERLVVRRDA